jgi:hypothetical protein
MKTEHWVEYLHPGSFYPEESRLRLKQYSATEALRKLPKTAFAFTLYDVEIRSGKLEDGETIEQRKKVNESGRFYPGGEIKYLEEIKSMGEGFEILASNMENNDWNSVVRTRAGNFQPFKTEDRITEDPARMPVWSGK